MLVYRSGANTINNFTPAVKDTTGARKGLSTMSAEADVLGNKAQIIDTDLLGDTLTYVENGGGRNSHVSILPAGDDASDTLLKEWATAKMVNNKGGFVHARSTAVSNARTGEWKK